MHRIVGLLLICSYLCLDVMAYGVLPFHPNPGYFDPRPPWIRHDFEEDSREEDSDICYKTMGFEYNDECKGFSCRNGRCFPYSFQCDGDNDCEDLTPDDEKDCEGFTLKLPIVECSGDEFQCHSQRECIPKGKFCDGIPNDCADASDEYEGCTKQLNCTDKFTCSNGHCINKDWRCDGMKDCSDGTDEVDCGWPLDPNECNNFNGRYLCNNKRCISLNVVCDTKDNCGDNSDEGANCTLAFQCPEKCAKHCTRTPREPVCICSAGFKLQENGTCLDIDECHDTYGICDQICENSPGSYSCSCKTDYTLQDDKKTCKADGGDATLVFSTRTEINGYYPDREMLFSIMPSRNFSNVGKIAMNGDYIYWSEKREEYTVIKRSNTHHEPESIITGGLHEISSLAVDWITGNIYFVDVVHKRIGVCNNKGKYCIILSSEEENRVTSLALYPKKGLMYWGDFNSIVMAGMDGQNKSSFRLNSFTHYFSMAFYDHVTPHDLVIDDTTERLYWVMRPNEIISSKLDGSDQRVSRILHEEVKHPIALTIFENNLYWSDSDSKSVQTCNKFTGKDWKILFRTSDIVYSMQIDHSAVKPKFPNPCHANPCSQLCMLNRDEGYTCGCTEYKKLNDDKHTCRDVKKPPHLIIAAEDTFIDYYLESIGTPAINTSTFVKRITAMTYDSLTGTIIANDQLSNYLIRYDPISGTVNHLLSTKNKVLGGIAFDEIGNNLYMTNMGDKTIEVYSLRTMEKTIFYFSNEIPQDIALFPEEGVMFVTFKKETEKDFQSYQVDKMRMNGIGTRKSISEAKGPKVSLFFNRDERVLYLCDETIPQIKIFDNERLRSYFFMEQSNMISIAVIKDSVFWTIRDSDMLYWANKTTHFRTSKHVALQMPKKVHLSLLAPFQGIITREERGCLKNNGNCSHVCLPSSATSYICACPPGMVLSANNRTCIANSICSSDKVKCSEHDICIKPKQWCDGVSDCPNGEDEQDGCKAIGLCKEKEFMCKDGTCIKSTGRCDSHYDCADRSDEADCHKHECRSEEFQCHEGKCISQSLVCDGNVDCPDVSDERNCDTHKCSSNYFACNTGKCIPISWKCDGEPDCPDGSDETGYCNTNVCGDGNFECVNGRCISASLKCNSINDCGDDSDESHCIIRGRSEFRNCTENEYGCVHSDICILKTKRCNGVQDCPKNDDEHHCASCSPEYEFTCDNQKCISKNWVCDSIDDCGDKSDETDCSGNTKIVKEKKCDEFRCDIGTCLPYRKVCDNIKDCPDGSDEGGGCSGQCKNFTCQDQCTKTPHADICSCGKGYRLDADGMSCKDINECEDVVCPQICQNTMGSFKCSCFSGYFLRSDGISCKAIGPLMQLISATDNDIRKISLNLRSIELIHELSGSGVTGLDANALDDTVYWSNEEIGTVNKINIKTHVSLSTGDLHPGALAIDWITNNVYFNDDDRPNVIKICNFEQRKCAVVVKIDKTAKVTSLIVNPTNRLLFWAQTTWRIYDKPSAEIYRSDMMGADMKMIGFRNISVVSGMAIDYIKSRLYWSDSFHKTIESFNLDGGERILFLNTDRYQPLGIQIFENSLYWLMGSEGKLQKCNLYGDKECEKTLEIGANNIHKHFTLLHVSKHPFVENLCKNQHCDYMCILKANGTACICQDGKTTKPGDTCPKSANNEITVASKISNVKSSNVQHDGGIYSVIVVALLIITALLCAHFFYSRHRLKLNSSANNSFNNIRFQNPSYDRRDEVAVTLGQSSTDDLHPGQHEYQNPVNDQLMEAAKNVTAKKLEQNLKQLEKESETENQETVRQDAALIYFGR